jgi:hypothetical protein
MLMNYHELTLGQPRDSASNRLQFRVICSIIMACLTYMILSSGALKPVVVTEGIFPGGDFLYKFTGRDYAASNSLVEHVASALKIRERHQEHVLYTIYLDDPRTIHGRRQRFASGILLNDQTSRLLLLQDKNTKKKKEEDHPLKNEEDSTSNTNNANRKATLLKINDSIKTPTRNEMETMAVHDLWPRLKYSSQKLPSVKAAVVKFPSTNGFVSSLVHSYKVRTYVRLFVCLFVSMTYNT